MTVSEQQKKIIDILKHKNTRKYCVYSTAALGIGYVAYKAYQRNVYQNSMRYLESIRSSLNKYKSAVDKGGDIVQTVLTDLYEYVLKDENDVPLSVQRLARLLQSEEVTTATRSTVRAAVEGFAAQGSKYSREDAHGGSSALDKVLEALLSEKGQNLVSVALGMAAKNVVSSYIQAQETGNEHERKQGSVDTLFSFLSHPRGQELAVRCIAACANSAMKAYMEQTIDINYYDQLFSTMVKPNHIDMVKECISISIQAAVSAYMGCHNVEEHVVDEERVENLTIAETTKNLKNGTVDVFSLAKQTCCDHIPSDDGEDSPCSALRPPLSVGTPSARANDFDDTVSTRSVRDIETRSRLGMRHRRKGNHDHFGGPTPTGDGLLRALGKEWIHVSQDANSRQAIVSVVGCVTKEAVGAVASTVADRLHIVWFLMVLLLGIFVSLVAQSMLHVIGISRL